jgi:nitronate monooxygenase
LPHPIIQAPLAGGGDTPELVAAVCEAGALGFIGAAYLTPAEIAEASLPAPAGAAFDEPLEAALESGAAVFSFTFGPLPPRAIEAVGARRMFPIGTATTVEEAIALEKTGGPSSPRASTRPA